MPKTLKYLAGLATLTAAIAAVGAAPAAADAPAARGVAPAGPSAATITFRSTGCPEGKVAIARKAVVGYGPGRICVRVGEGPASGSRVDPLLAATAVDTLAHEAIHVAGIRNEARTECYAMQLTRFTSEELGTDASYGAALTRVLWDGYEEYGAANPDYYSEACRNGGPLDLNPDDPFFWP